ncbi:MAG: hypothetical protein JEY94_12430 [Melioribacteraceae bacterium]|nr:hypothetical protein [Melioribacteraceae bacterium]
MKKYILMLLIPVLGLVSCDLLDPSDVHNPAVTEEKLLADATGGAGPLLAGLQFKYSDAILRMAIYSECVSDNYDNTSTFLSSIFDKPHEIIPGEQYLDDRREIYAALQYLRNQSELGLNVILPQDGTSTDEHEAETHFYKGMAILMLAENFAAFPIVDLGGLVRAEEALPTAISELKTSYDMVADVKCKIALARAYRLLGDKGNAKLYADEAVSMTLDYVLLAQYDVTNLDNDVYDFTVSRTLHDMQPLPRLDFLDPKYVDEVSPVPTLKIEDSYLVLAEIAIANGDETEAKTQLINCITLAKSREVTTFDDVDPRDDRPSNPAFTVKADANAPAVSGLIADRSTTLESHEISNTSLTEEYVNAVSGKEDLYHTLYLLRQEIFFAEGRRMSDLGIRLPVNRRQIETSSSIAEGVYGTSIIVPSFIPTSDEMDQFAEVDGVVTILHDMNRKIAQNTSVAFVAPFE